MQNEIEFKKNKKLHFKISPSIDHEKRITFNFCAFLFSQLSINISDAIKYNEPVK